MITYLIGAGASANCLPVVANLPDRVIDVIERLKGDSLSLAQVPPTPNDQPSYEEMKLRMMIDMQWLADKASLHASVDTFAKKLYLTGKHDELKKLKCALTSFFIIWQSLKQNDMRYDTFFASILNISGTSLPEKIRIVSWNYDFQLEIAYREYFGNHSIRNVRSALNVFSKESQLANKKGGFAVYKLNGTASVYDDFGRPHELIDQYDEEFTTNHLVQVVNAHFILMNQSNPKLSLSFAWEGGHRDFLGHMASDVSETEVLVIIGYSFPFFNRGVDSFLLNAMGKLKKVYIQSEEANNIRDRFIATRERSEGMDIRMSGDIGQFLLPNELAL